MPSQICSIPECFIALSTRAWLVPSVSAPISSTAEWVFTQLSTILLSFTLEWAFVLSNCLPTMMWNHTGCFVLTFLLCVYKWYFKLLAWEDIYIYSQSLHFVWIFSAVYFQSSNDLRINYHIGYICQTFLTWENFCTTSALSPEMRPLPSVSFHVHLQVVSTRKRFST